MTLSSSCSPSRLNLTDSLKRDIYLDQERALNCPKDKIEDCFAYALAVIAKKGEAFDIKYLKDNRPPFVTNESWRRALKKAQDIQLPKPKVEASTKLRPFFNLGRTKLPSFTKDHLILKKENLWLSPRLFPRTLANFLFLFKKGPFFVRSKHTLSFAFFDQYYRLDLSTFKLSSYDIDIKSGYPLIDIHYPLNNKEIIIHNLGGPLSLYRLYGKKFKEVETYFNAPDKLFYEVYRKNDILFLLTKVAGGYQGKASRSLKFNLKTKEVSSWSEVSGLPLTLLEYEGTPIPLMESGWGFKKYPKELKSKILYNPHSLVATDLDGDKVSDFLTMGLGNLKNNFTNEAKRELRKKCSSSASLKYYEALGCHLYQLSRGSCNNIALSQRSICSLLKFPSNGTALKEFAWGSLVYSSKKGRRLLEVEKRLDKIPQAYGAQNYSRQGRNGALIHTNHKMADNSQLYFLSIKDDLNLKRIELPTSLNITGANIVTYNNDKGEVFIIGLNEYNQIFVWKDPLATPIAAASTKGFRTLFKD